MKKVLVIGSINMDLNFRVDELPKRGQTVMGHGFSKAHGGKGANQAVAAARLGTPTTMMGCVGNDSEGKELLEGLKKDGIDTSRILVTNDLPTGMADITIEESGMNTIVFNAGANFNYPKDYVEQIKKEINNFDIIVAQFEMPYDVCVEIMQYAHGAGKTVILNPAPARKIDKKLLDCVDYLIPNETELGVISGVQFEPTRENAVKVAKDFLNKYETKNLLVTLGDKGSVCVNKETGKDIFVEPMKVKAVDSTAAGDSYLGAVVYGLANDWDMEKTMKFAAKVGALVVTKLGAQTSIPTMAEVENFHN